MDFYDVISARKSVRRYQNVPVEPEKLERVLDAARSAPSADNSQEWRFVVVTDPAVRNDLAGAAAEQDYILEAPVVIACCAETQGELMRCGLPKFTVDVTLAVDHLMLAATSEELGTCWTGHFNPGRVKAVLGIPAGVEVVALLALGYAEYPEPETKNRLPLERIVHYERWKPRD